MMETRQFKQKIELTFEFYKYNKKLEGRFDILEKLVPNMRKSEWYRESSLSATSLSVVLTLVRFIINSTKIWIVRNPQ